MFGYALFIGIIPAVMFSGIVAELTMKPQEGLFTQSPN